MDFLKDLAGGPKQGQAETEQTGEQKESGGLLGGFGDKLNNAAGGGAQSEKNEDMLDKGTFVVGLPSKRRLTDRT